jgi:very-short-patch-repair endonuclease
MKLLKKTKPFSKNLPIMPNHNNKLHHHANPSTYEIARVLRKQQTEAEELLWQLLRNRKVCNLKFRRQHPFENFVLDFYCHEVKLVIEADGNIHNEKDVIEYDNARTARLNEEGITVLRFTNDEIKMNADFAINKIKSWINENEAHI